MWAAFQKEYVHWATSSVPEDYRQITVNLLRRFNEWIHLDSCNGLILDVGCGINQIGGMTYKEFFGFDDSTRPNWIGIDPLLGRCTVQAIAENLPFRTKTFAKGIVYTSLDHFRDFPLAFSEILRVSKEVDLWFTEMLDPEDKTHPYRVKLEDIQRLRGRVESLKEPWPKSKLANTVFVKILPSV